MEQFIKTLESEFSKNSDRKSAIAQSAYMKNKFEFYGIRTQVRRKIQKPFLDKDHLPTKKEAKELIKLLWLRPQREYQYFCQELAYRYSEQGEEDDIELFEFMVLHKGWWDTVDFIATKLMGAYFKSYPDNIDPYVRKWISSKNRWLQRSVLLFQLMYKENLDTKILTFTINGLLGSNEFFINKAIGWILRQYSRTDPQWVIDFVGKTPLSTLSSKEALRLVT